MNPPVHVAMQDARGNMSKEWQEYFRWVSTRIAALETYIETLHKPLVKKSK